MLHPAIANKVWLDLSLDGGGIDASDAEIGVELMGKAFNPSDGPLTDMQQEKGEREALAQMFAGAIGSYKNPHSHRTVSVTDPREAQEMVMHASHLLRIVEARAANRKPATAA